MKIDFFKETTTNYLQKYIKKLWKVIITWSVFARWCFNRTLSIYVDWNLLIVTCGGPSSWRLLHSWYDVTASCRYLFLDTVKSFIVARRLYSNLRCCCCWRNIFLFCFFVTFGCWRCWKSEIIIQHYFWEVKYIDRVRLKHQT